MSQLSILAILPPTEAEALSALEISQKIGVQKDNVQQALRVLRKWGELSWKQLPGVHGKRLYWQKGGPELHEEVVAFHGWKKEWSDLLRGIP